MDSHPLYGNKVQVNSFIAGVYGSYSCESHLIG